MLQSSDDADHDRADRLGTLLLAAAGISALGLPLTALRVSEILEFCLGFALPLTVLAVAFLGICLGVLPAAARSARRKTAWAIAVAVVVLAAWWAIIWWSTRGWVVTIYR